MLKHKQTHTFFFVYFTLPLKVRILLRRRLSSWILISPRNRCLATFPQRPVTSLVSIHEPSLYHSRIHCPFIDGNNVSAASRGRGCESWLTFSSLSWSFGGTLKWSWGERKRSLLTYYETAWVASLRSCIYQRCPPLCPQLSPPWASQRTSGQSSWVHVSENII